MSTHVGHPTLLPALLCGWLYAQVTHIIQCTLRLSCTIAVWHNRPLCKLLQHSQHGLPSDTVYDRYAVLWWCIFWQASKQFEGRHLHGTNRLAVRPAVLSHRACVHSTGEHCCWHP